MGKCATDQIHVIFLSIILGIICMGCRFEWLRNSFIFLMGIKTMPSNVIECIYKIEGRTKIAPSNSNSIFK